MALINEVHPLNYDAWDEWTEYRQTEKKKKIGPMAEMKQTRFLQQFPPPLQQEIIDQSIMNSWQGLFPPKNQRTTPALQQDNTRSRSLMDDLTDVGWAYE